MKILKHQEMPCRDFVECVTMYIEGTLSRRDRRRLEQHLAECGPCTLYLEQLRDTLQVAGKIEPDEVPAHMREELVRVFERWRAPL